VLQWICWCRVQLSQWNVWLRTRRPGDRGSIPGGGKEDFFSSFCVQTGSETHPASCAMDTGGPFPGDKARPGRDADNSPPSSADVENE
jgi:hypothetical protein